MLRVEPKSVAHRQHRNAQAVVDARTGRSHTTIRPDFLLSRGEGSERQLPVDAKYKRYERRRVSTSDVYQMSAYAQAFAGPPGDGTPSALLVFPAQSGYSRQLEFRSTDGRTRAFIEVHGLAMEQLFDQLREPAAGRSTRLELSRLPDSLAEIAVPGAAEDFFDRFLRTTSTFKEPYACTAMFRKPTIEISVSVKSGSIRPRSRRISNPSTAEGVSQAFSAIRWLARSMHDSTARCRYRAV